MTFQLARLVETLAARDPEAPAVTLDGVTRTFGDVDRRSNALARALSRRGVGPGDRVAILSRNSTEYWEAVFACAKLRSVLVAVNWRLSAREVAAVVVDSAPRMVLVQDEFVANLPGNVTPVRFGVDYEALLAAESEAAVAVEVFDDDVVLQLYSSGTTGRPKGVLITNANLSPSPESAEHFYAMGPDSVNLVVSPLFHIGGIGYGLTAFSRGGHTVLVSESDGDSLVEAIRRHGVTHSFMVPALVQTLVEAPAVRAGADLSSLQYIAYGGAPMSPSGLRRAMAALGCGFLAVYGMTETSGTVIGLAAEDHDPEGDRSHLLRSCGRPLPWVEEVGVFDPITGEPQAVGEVGEIWVRSRSNTSGYWNQPEATREALLESGWLRTGDAAYLDDGGYFYLHDRMKDMIITGGENVYPAEVEAVLYELTSVQEAAVIGVPSEKWGETIKAILVPRDGVDLDAAEVIAFCRDNLAHYKCPTSVDVVATLPRNASGKILKHQLRAQFAPSPVGSR